MNSLRFSQLRVGQAGGFEYRTVEERRDNVSLVSQTRRDGPGGAVWITTHVENYRRRAL